FSPTAGAPAAMAVNSVTAAAAFLVSAYWLRARLPERPKQVVIKGRQWLWSSIPMAAADAMRTVQPQLVILILASATDPSQVGLFRIAVSILTALSAPAVLINAVVFPLLSTLHAEKDDHRLQVLVTRSAQAQFAATLILSAPLLVAGRPLLTSIFGAEYGPAALPVAILLVGMIINTAFGPNTPLLNATHHEGRVTRAMMAAIVLTVVSTPVLGWLYGAVGAAIAVFIGQLGWNVLASIDAKKLLGINTSSFGNWRTARSA
ncbi:MAG TPA: polysaccharide biosynthesis C-terminal domain-containing protein, partial [Verrucomicrobiae bacterium]|nr:polysaccharide biosynthesis C-terminal domain-containing protein [Verrucomicrobiae bacterium]